MAVKMYLCKMQYTSAALNLRTKRVGKSDSRINLKILLIHFIEQNLAFIPCIITF
jgi:hypothetical protein